jgi:hypothetical protein
VQRPELATDEIAERIEALVGEGVARSALRLLCEVARAGEGIDLFALEARLAPDEQSWLREAALFEAASSVSSFDFDLIDDILRWLSKRRIDAQSRQVSRLLREATADANQLLAEKQRLLDERRRAQRVPVEPVR